MMITEPIEDTVRAGATPDRGQSISDSRAASNLTSIEILTYLVLRKWIIAKVTGIGAVAAIVLSLVLPVRYKGTAKMMPPRQTPSEASLFLNQLTSSAAGSLMAATSGGLSLKDPNEIYIGLLKTRPVADAIINRFQLSAVYRASNMTDARKALANHTTIETEKSGFIVISVTDKDKKRAPAMANAYAEQLRLLTRTLAVTEASQRRLFYDEQLKQTRDALVAAQMDFQQVQEKKGLVSLDAQSKTMFESLAALHAQIVAKQVQVQALRSYSTDRNPDVQMAENQLASLQAEAARLEQRGHTSVPSGLGLEDVPGAGMEYVRAQHNLQYQQALFDLLLKQYDAARLDEAKEAAIIQVVEPAIEPDKRSFPRRTQLVALITIADFCGVCLVLLITCRMESGLSEPGRTAALRDLKRALWAGHPRNPLAGRSTRSLA